MENNFPKYLIVGSHLDLTGKDRVVYRLLEILPAFLSLGTIGGMVLASWLYPLGAAIFIIIFDIYWLAKTFYLSQHLRANYFRLKKNLAADWQEKLANLKWENIWHLVITPMHKEKYEVVKETYEALANAKWAKERMIVVIAVEERAGEEALKTAKEIEKNYSDKFGRFLIAVHPANLESEIPGKGSNSAYAAKKAKEEIIDKLKIPYENIIVSCFDIDTRVYPQYFLCLTYNFLTAEKPHCSSYQPIPMYHNNVWEAPAISRVIAASGTFWQMMNQERPERLATFSSHSMSFKALADVGFWQKNIVSEDSRIFFNSLIFYNGDYGVVPLSYPVSMDANLGKNLWETIKQIYKQQRRWFWGCENIPYIIFNFIKNSKMPFRTKVYYIFLQIEGFWSLATNALLIFALGWLPLVLGGEKFNASLVSYNLPLIARYLMTISMAGLIVSAIISAKLLPPKPAHLPRTKYLFLFLEWLLIPVTLIFFGAIPALESQIRLALGKPLGFWVTPKHR